MKPRPSEEAAVAVGRWPQAPPHRPHGRARCCPRCTRRRPAPFGSSPGVVPRPQSDQRPCPQPARRLPRRAALPTRRRRRPSPARRLPTVGAPRAGQAQPAPAARPREPTTLSRRRSGRYPARRPPARSVRRNGPRNPRRRAPGRARPSPAPTCANRAAAETMPGCCGPTRPTDRPHPYGAAPPDRDRRCHSDLARPPRRPATTTAVAWSPSAAASCQVCSRRQRRPTFGQPSKYAEFQSR